VSEPSATAARPSFWEPDLDPADGALGPYTEEAAYFGAMAAELESLLARVRQALTPPAAARRAVPIDPT
jgi:hypothetical protein